MSEQFVAAIDQGTTSTRCMVFNREGRVVSVDQREHEQIFPRAGWVEHNAKEIWENTRAVAAAALGKVDLTEKDIAAVGITNQRETALVWDKTTGEPVYNAIVWQDTRTDQIVHDLGDLGGGAERYKAKVGLPLATYFSGPKVKWILDNVEGAREKAEAGDLLFGNMDTWTVWNMTGGVDGGLHITEPTNASRTMLMDLETLSWDADIAKDMGIPLSMLPEIRSSSEVYGNGREKGSFAGVPIAGILGDQQAATFGQACLSVGEAKNTYGTGNFMLINTGTEVVPSKNGLLTTVCYKIGDQPTVYALEGSIAVSGSLVQWVRDNLGLIGSAPEIETLAATVEDNGGCYFVPAFSGPVRAVLARRCPRRDRRAHPVREQGSHRPRRAGGHRVPDQGSPGRDERRLRGRPDRAQGRRRHGRQRDPDAVPGRHSRCAGDPSGGRRDHRARRCLRGRPGGWVLEVRGRHPQQLGRVQAVGAEHGRGHQGQAVQEVEEGRHQDLRLGRQ